MLCASKFVLYLISHCTFIICSIIGYRFYILLHILRRDFDVKTLVCCMRLFFLSDITQDILASLAQSAETHSSLDSTMSLVDIMTANLTRFLEFASDVSNFDTSLLNGIREKSQ